MTPIIYLHGFASGPQSTKAQFLRRKFSGAGWHLETPSLEPHGFENLTISSALSVIEQCARGAPCILVGSSMGGYLAALYAARRQEVERLVLLAPAFEFARRWESMLGPERWRQWQREGMLEFFHYAAGAPRRLSYRFIEDALRYEDYPEFRQPALIIHGVNDDVVPVELSRRFVAAHPNAALREVESGHELTSVLDALWQWTREFLGASPGLRG